jgi:alpha-N-arabinofuranosidase
MDGPWQMQAKTATEYGRIATEAAKMMRMVDDTLELAACGSSGRNMPTFGAWEDTVLEHCFEHVDTISLHTYLNNYAKDTPALLASPDLMDSFIHEVAAIADAVAARRRSSKRIMLSFDEWNVWYRTRRNRAERVLPGWPVAPHILEEVYTMADALAFGGACIALLNHADRVTAACLAQLVNAIAPIMTETGGAAWRQTIFWPFAQWSRHGRGLVLRAECDSPTYDVRYFDPRGPIDQWYPVTAPFLKLGAVRQDDGGLNLFALNRNLEEAMPLDIATPGFAALELAEAQTLHHANLDAVNTAANPDRVAPSPLAGIGVGGEHVSVTLPSASWNLLRLRPRA